MAHHIITRSRIFFTALVARPESQIHVSSVKEMSTGDTIEILETETLRDVYTENSLAGYVHVLASRFSTIGGVDTWNYTLRIREMKTNIKNFSRKS